MAGRKTIMVDGGVWNKVEELKHNAYLRSSGDAIETAVDIASSDKYYAGIHTMKNKLGSLFHVVESLGRTEDEAIRKLLLFEQGSIYGDLRAEDIPPADETDIEKEGLFVIECTKRLYHAGLLFNDPAFCKEYEGPEGFGNPFSCRITHTRATKNNQNTTLIADSDETGWNKYYVLVDEWDGSDIVRIVDYGTSPIRLHSEMLVKYEGYFDEDMTPDIVDYNSKSYKIYPCTPRLFAECIGNTFQNRFDSEIYGNPKREEFEEFFGHGIRDETTHEDIIDTTPEGKYYAALLMIADKKGIVRGVGDTANKASLGFLGPDPVLESDEGFFEPDLFWTDVEKNGERIGGERGEYLLVECTAEVYCQYLMAGEKDWVTCTVDGDVGNRMATLLKVVSSKEERNE